MSKPHIRRIGDRWVCTDNPHDVVVVSRDGYTPHIAHRRWALAWEAIRATHLVNWGALGLSKSATIGKFS